MLLETNEEILGQKINKRKTTLFFSQNAPINQQKVIKDTLGKGMVILPSPA